MYKNLCGTSSVISSLLASIHYCHCDTFLYIISMSFIYVHHRYWDYMFAVPWPSFSRIESDFVHEDGTSCALVLFVADYSFPSCDFELTVVSGTMFFYLQYYTQHLQHWVRLTLRSVSVSLGPFFRRCLSMCCSSSLWMSLPYWCAHFNAKGWEWCPGWYYRHCGRSVRREIQTEVERKSMCSKQSMALDGRCRAVRMLMVWEDIKLFCGIWGSKNAEGLYYWHHDIWRKLQGHSLIGVVNVR